MTKTSFPSPDPDGGAARLTLAPSQRAVFLQASCPPSGPFTPWPLAGRTRRSSVYGAGSRASCPANTVNSGANTVKSGLRKTADVLVLQGRIAAAVARHPAKEWERATQLPAREAEELATGLRLPRLPNLARVTRHDPECLEAVVRFLAGETGTGAPGEDPAKVIAELIRRLSCPAL